MKTTFLAVMAVIALAGCSKDDPAKFPELTNAWRVESGAAVCVNPDVLQTAPDAAPFVRVTCTWHNVYYGGQNRCSVIVTYERPDASAAWPPPVVFATHADCSQ